jgi:hypothetical protein
MTHTQRTLKYLRGNGRTCGIVERFIPSKPFGKRIDLFGIIDIIAVDKNITIGVQSCGSDFAEHDRKILESEMAKEWVTGRQLMLIGWRKVKQKRGGKRMIYKPRIKLYTKEDFQ